MARLIPDDVWAALTVWAEARGETQDGRVAVAEVVRNRTAQRYASSGTVASTVLWPLQFSAWNSTDTNRAKAAMLDDADAVYQGCLAAWQTAQAGSDVAKGAVLYLNPTATPNPPSWVAKSVLTAIIGAHHFYKPKT